MPRFTYRRWAYYTARKFGREMVRVNAQREKASQDNNAAEQDQPQEKRTIPIGKIILWMFAIEAVVLCLAMILATK